MTAERICATLPAPHLEEVMETCLLPQCALLYYNVTADAHGEASGLEGSATDCEPIYIKDDILAYANHDASLPMGRFEANRDSTAGSIIQRNRERRLLPDDYGELSPALFQRLLADHAK
jgi:hypothetical protein